MTTSQRQRFRELYREHYAPVFGYCARRSSREDARDATAEVFTVVWRRIDVVPVGDSTRPWLFGVAAKVLANQRRGSARRLRLVKRVGGLAPDSISGDPSVQVVRDEVATAVVAALRRLKASDQEVLTLSTWEGLTAPQLAERFSISLKAAEKRLTRARRRLAAQLASDPAVTTAAGPYSKQGGAP